jgi:hypothetical protein
MLRWWPRDLHRHRLASPPEEQPPRDPAEASPSAKSSGHVSSSTQGRESNDDALAEGENGADVLVEAVVDEVNNAATVEERPSTPSVPDLIYPYPRGSASGSSAFEGRLHSPCSPEREDRRRHRWGGDGRREQGSLPVGDRDERGTWGERWECEIRKRV